LVRFFLWLQFIIIFKKRVTVKVRLLPDFGLSQLC